MPGTSLEPNTPIYRPRLTLCVHRAKARRAGGSVAALTQGARGCDCLRMQKLLLGSLISALSAVGSLAAQEPPPAVPDKPAVSAPAPETENPNQRPAERDPQSGNPVTPPFGAAQSVAARNVFTSIETWALSQSDFSAYLEEPASNVARYERLEALARSGKAKLTNLIALNTKSGQRGVVECIDEVRYPTEFAPPARAGEAAYPTAFETRNTGETLELEPIVSRDGKIEVNLVPQTVRFEGFLDWSPEAKAVPTGLAQFRTERFTTSVQVTSGQPVFLSTATPRLPDENPGPKPIRVRVIRTSVQPVSPAPPTPGPVQARVEFLVYAMDRDAARRILNGSANSAESYAAVQALVAKGAAQLETASAFVARSGQRAVNQENTEFSFPSGFTPPKFDSQSVPRENRQPPVINQHETRQTGVTVEIEPVFSPDARIVDINVVPKIVRFAGLLKAGGGAAKYPAQPVFATRMVTTSASTTPGVPVLLGTLSQPADTGVNDRKDDGRTSLAYIRVTAVQP